MAEERTPLAEALKPSGLAERGEALWRALGGDSTNDGARAVLIAEASRLADVLEGLDRLIGGDVDTWTSISIPDGDKDLVLRIDAAVSERRQTVTVFRHVIAQLTNVAVPAGAAQTKTAGGGGEGGGGLDDLEERRAARRADAAGS
ncbi:hypothetical protein [Rhodococcoides fascians]|uniref:hypothetical protein n=1 Tax=Rhodococcoides fascians TaxID=1828 RepID=UPI000689EC65|nr:hypothetical protein [Rhodococcus fascians]